MSAHEAVANRTSRNRLEIIAVTTQSLKAIFKTSVLSAFASLLLGAGIVAGTSTEVTAQSTSPGISPFPVRPGSKPTRQRGVDISVSYQFYIPGNANDLTAQAELSEKGRRALYTLLGNECDTLIETIASSCEITRANVNSQINRSRTRRGGVRVSGSATYRIRFRNKERPANNGAQGGQQ